jgi:divalent metal cation (Fe/Co/Zn/Cd) transporter
LDGLVETGTGEPGSLVGTNSGGDVLLAGYRISIGTLAWTLSVGGMAIAVGTAAGSLTLLVFGAIGLLDAAGSSVLIVHFRHALHHQSISKRHERTALFVVTVGMAAVGAATIADSAVKLAQHGGSHAPGLGIGLAAASVVVLSAFSTTKRRIAPRIPSRALLADGWLSGMGALLALVTLVGTGLEAAIGWWWLDPAGALALGTGAVLMSWVLGHGERTPVGEDTGGG